MYCSGVGKAIMAELPESAVKQIWNESIIEKKTEHTITDYDDMLSVLKEAKRTVMHLMMRKMKKVYGVLLQVLGIIIMK